MRILVGARIEKLVQKFCLVAAMAVLVGGLTACGGGGDGDDDSEEPQPQSFTVTAEAGAGGSISPATQTVESGGKAVVTLETDVGYTISSVTGCDGTLDGVSYETGTIIANCTINATFVAANGESPTAKILFPWKYSRTNESTIVVRGVASGSNIKTIRVNGVEAVLASQVSQSAFAIRSGVPMAAGVSSDEDVSWEAAIVLPESDDTSIVVEIENTDGEKISNADSVEVFKRRVPTFFAIDSVNRKLVGQTNSQQLALYDLDGSQYQTIDLEEQNPCSALAYKPDSAQAICAELISDKLYLSGITIDSKEQIQIYQHDLNLDPEEWSFAHVQELALSNDSASLFILLKIFSAIEYELNKSVILRYDFSNGMMTNVVDGKTQSDKLITSDSFAYTDAGLLVFSRYWGDGDDGLRLIDFAGEDSDFVSSESNLLLSSIDVNAANDAAYLAGYDGIVRVNLPDGTKNEISLESEEELFNISQIRSTGLDELNNRLLIADDGFDYILSVDLDTGERSEFAANGVGDGKRLLTPRALALDELNNVAYLLDESSGGILIRVDLNTGDRTVTAKFEFECHHQAQEVIFDVDAQQLYALFSNAVFQVNPAENYNVIRIDSHSGESDCSESTVQFTGAALDKENNRLLITDSVADALLEMDLATGVGTPLVESSENFDAAVDVFLDDDNDIAYILSQANGDLHAYNLASGETTLILDACPNSWGDDSMDQNQGGVQSMYLDQARNTLWITAESVIKYSLDTESCEVMDSLGAVDSTLGLTVTEEGQLLGTQFRQMVQIDFESGKQVVISK